jgi:hypothetical protein
MTVCIVFIPVQFAALFEKFVRLYLRFAKYSFVPLVSFPVSVWFNLVIECSAFSVSVVLVD